MKKILIMTLPLGTNYGGILQAYALSKTISDAGFQPVTSYSEGPLLKRIVKNAPIVGALMYKLKGAANLDKKKVQNTSKHTRVFIDNYIPTVAFNKALVDSSLGRYGSYVVGSDQVWRNAYVYIPHYLFSFAKANANKLSYAASFGRDDLSEYPAELIKRSSSFASSFSGISTREDSGVALVRHGWNLAAESHVDPTLLVDKSQYIALVENSTHRLIESKGNVFSYVLDTSAETQLIQKRINELVGGTLFNVISEDLNAGEPLPPVEQWIKSFHDAEFIVTDSFHGTVFAIIFNKPFIAVGNKARGLARFTSLLGMFGLGHRLVSAPEQVTKKLIDEKIDWVAVNKKVAAEQKRSKDYLQKHIGEEA